MRAELLCVGYICIGCEIVLHLIHIPTEDECGSAEMQMHWLFFSIGVTLNSEIPRAKNDAVTIRHPSRTV